MLQRDLLIKQRNLQHLWPPARQRARLVKHHGVDVVAPLQGITTCSRTQGPGCLMPHRQNPAPRTLLLDIASAKSNMPAPLLLHPLHASQPQALTPPPNRAPLPPHLGDLPLMRTPSDAPTPVPTITAVGVARPRAQGQAMTRTAMPNSRANRKWVWPSGSQLSG